MVLYQLSLGNCLFRATSFQVYYTSLHHYVRQKVCTYIWTRRESFLPFLDEGENINAYVSKMRRDGTWGGNLELQAISRLYKHNIIIYSSNQGLNLLENGFSESMALWFAHGSHYDAVYPAQEVQELERAQNLAYRLIHQALGLPHQDQPVRNLVIEDYNSRKQRQTDADLALAVQQALDQQPPAYDEDEALSIVLSAELNPAPDPAFDRDAELARRLDQQEKDAAFAADLARRERDEEERQRRAAVSHAYQTGYPAYQTGYQTGHPANYYPAYSSASPFGYEREPMPWENAAPPPVSTRALVKELFLGRSGNREPNHPPSSTGPPHDFRDREKPKKDKKKNRKKLEDSD